MFVNIKFEHAVRPDAKNNPRVKALSFHPKRPWILASLHNGTIQLWDYRMEALIDKFEEHEGPVRGVDFHHSQPLFVSGGDDYKIKVWNYQQRRCLFNLLGHMDYIRTVQFHHEYPWILSASDDQTIRIWNWQSRTCLSVLTGHNHYVMCAQFSPREDLIVSASLDQTVRVWDFSGLRKKHVSIGGGLPDMSDSGSDRDGDLFGASEVNVKHVLEGHTRGVNWAAFHRTLPLIVSAADDRDVKMWRMNESKAWEIDTFRGHVNNVSCAIFHPKKELVISNSEDRSLRIWDVAKQQNTVIYRKDAERFWVIEAHPTANLLAAGHDYGFMIFKLHRERPAFDVQEGNLYYYKEQYVYEHNLATGKEKAILCTRRRPGQAAENPRSLCYNATNRGMHCVLFCTDSDASYELFAFQKSDSAREEASGSMRGYGLSAAFISGNRFVVQDKLKSVWLKSLKNEVKRRIALPKDTPIAQIFPGGVGRVLFRTSEGMVLYDIQASNVVAELPITSRHPIKYVSWSRDHKYVAMYGRSTIVIANTNLEELTSITESARIKSGVWDARGVFVYTTGTHVKYLLTNGDNGVIKTLDNPIYLVAVNGQEAIYLDREAKVGRLILDTTEYLFKLAVTQRNSKEVLSILANKKLVGQSIVAYLQKKGHPEVALHFVEDPSLKFALALECGDIRVALECATQLDTNEAWHRLGVEALRQGNHQVVEAAYQKTKNFERLSFLYLITGNTAKLAKMLHISTIRKDLQGQFHNALYLGSVEDRVTALLSSNQFGLAWVTAKTHGLEEVSRSIEEQYGDRLPAGLTSRPEYAAPSTTTGAQLLFPPQPILREANWPLLDVRKGFFDHIGAGASEEVVAATAAAAAAEAHAASAPEDAGQEDDLLAGSGELGGAASWGDGGDLGSLGIESKQAGAAAAGGWGDDLPDVGLPDVGADAAAAASSSSAAGPADYFVMPVSGKSAAQKWGSSSSVAADLVAAGSFDLAMHMLNRQLGIVNFAPLKPYFLSIFSASHCAVPLAPGFEGLLSPLQRSSRTDEKTSADLPVLPFQLSYCIELAKTARKHVTEGKFSAALSNFTEILQTLPMLVVEKQAQIVEMIELIAVCKEYITALRLEAATKDVSADAVRKCALSAYFTQCQLQPLHIVLGLKVAIKSAYSVQNFKMTAGFCRRLLELCLSSTTVMPAPQQQQVKGILATCETKNTNASEIDYREDTDYVLCCATLKPVATGAPAVFCPYCKSGYSKEFEGTVCKTCELAKIGAKTTGLHCINSAE